MSKNRHLTQLAVAGASAVLITLPLMTPGMAQAKPPASPEPASATATRIPGFTPGQSALEKRYEDAFQSQVSAKELRNLAHQLTAKPGMAGTKLDHKRTQMIVKWLRSWGLNPQVKTYYPYLSKPRDIKVTMTKPEHVSFPLKPGGFPWQKDYKDVVEGFNAYSPSGNMKEPVVFVNYGLKSDYQELAKLGVSVKGKIVLAKYGNSARGAKTSIADEHGAKGVILYSDPADDGFIKGAAYPNGPWKGPNDMQRGSAMYWWQYPGDPLTPGRAATKNAHRLKPSQAKNLPQLPTTPIGYGAARRLLEAMQGPQAPKDWQGGLPITYHLGGTDTPVVHLKIDDDRSVKPIHDVVVRIPGKTHPNQRVMAGGHYDAWTYGTADNGSGAVDVLELAHSLATLRDQGHRPDRTIQLNLWDSEEFGMIGSTEYAEAQGRKLNNVVAYLNLDGGGGKNFDASGVPSLDQLILDVSKDVIWPYTGKSVYDSWSDQVGRLGSGSDYTAYIDHFGVPSAAPGSGSAGGQYHTAFDDNYTMDHFLDPTYGGHAGTTKMIGMMALRLANANIPQFDYANYATQVSSYLDGIKKSAQQQFGQQELYLGGVRQAANAWKKAARRLDQDTNRLLGRGTGTRAQYDVVTSALMSNERALVTSKGLAQRPYGWFRHQIYATGIDSGYSVEFLPGIQDAIEAGNIAQARKYTHLLERSIRHATQQLRSANRTIR